MSYEVLLVIQVYDGKGMGKHADGMQKNEILETAEQGDEDEDQSKPHSKP